MQQHYFNMEIINQNPEEYIVYLAYKHPNNMELGSKVREYAQYLLKKDKMQIENPSDES